MIFKILLFLLAIFLVYLIFFKKNREQQIKQNDKNTIEKEDIMVECPTCKVFVSKKEGILSNGRYFCSKECLK